MPFRYEIRLSGAGGQGLILAGKIIAEAAVIFQDLNATQSQSYGPEARGGASRSEVVISDEEIDYPKTSKVDLLLAMTQEAFDKYLHEVKDDGMIIIDSGYVKSGGEEVLKVFSVPITEIAEKETGRSLTANIVALGVITILSKIITEVAVKEAIMARVPKGTEEMNLKAFAAGIRIGNELKSRLA